MTSDETISIIAQIDPSGCGTGGRTYAGRAIRSRASRAGWLGDALRQPRTDVMTNLSFIDPPSLRSMDSSPIRGTSLELLDMDKVTTHIERAVKRGATTGPPTERKNFRRNQ